MIDMKKKLDEDEISEDMNTTEPVEDNSPEENESVSNAIDETTGDDTDIPNEKSETVDDEADTFPRDYVEKLRDENAKYRQRAQRADELALRLHAALTESTGRLQDAGDLPFEESHIDNPEALTGAIDELLAAKPHLAARRPTGNIGQGTSSAGGNVDLLGMLRARA